MDDSIADLGSPSLSVEAGSVFASDTPHSLSYDAALQQDIADFGEMSMQNAELGLEVAKGESIAANLSGQPHSGNGHRDSQDSQSNQPPPWSELKTKAGKERKRLPLACIACRRKKIRCSGEKPACKHCLLSRIPCVYKVTTRKAAPRTDYMAMLDKRLKRMEERVIRIIPKEDHEFATSVTRAVVKPALPTAPTKASGTKKRDLDAAFTNELDQWAGIEVDSKLQSDAQSSATNEPLKGEKSEEQGILEEGADELPSKEVQAHLSEVFFDYVYGQGYHLLHKPSFMRRLAQGTVPAVLMLAICAISARFSTHPEVRTEPVFLRGENWARAARGISLRRYDTPNLTILIVYIILGLHEFGTCQGGRSWMFGGMAQRMAYALQLHRDLDHDPKSREVNDKNEITFTDREIRRRTMWSCFLMDRFNSSGTDRPIFIAEQYIRAQLPIKESFYQMEITGPTEDLEGNVPHPVGAEAGQMTDPKSNMGVAAYQIRLIGIWGKLVHYLNLGGKEQDLRPMWASDSKFASLQRAAQKWKDELPESLQYNAENLQSHASENIANQLIFLHITYNQVILFLHRFAVPIPGARNVLPPDMPQDFVAAAAKTAHEAANQISLLVEGAMDYRVVAPFAGYCAFFSSTVQLHGAFSGNATVAAASKANLARNVKFLDKMKKYWGMFHFVTENLRDLYRRHADAARNGGLNASAKGDEPGIFQYGDWFDRYPHGLTGTNFEESTPKSQKEAGEDGVLGKKSDLQTVEEFFAKMTPPSRAVHSQPQVPRKMAKARRSKSESKSNTEATAQRQAVRQEVRQQSQPNMDQVPELPETALLTQPFEPFPRSFQQDQTSLLASMPQQFMPQLDRQIVLNSYASTNQNPTVMNPLQYTDFTSAMVDPTTQQSFGAFDMGSYPSNGNSTIWGDASTGWFLPFNMEPPPVGDDDSNLFNVNYNWSDIGGFGDLSSAMPSTGLTPGQDVEMMLEQTYHGDGEIGGDASAMSSMQ